MTLRIVKASEPVLVERLNLCIYAAPGVGKTTLGFTAEDPLNLDFDKGTYRAANRRDTVPISAWPDVESITAEDLKPYKTVVVDTAGRALDFLSLDITKADPKAGSGSNLTLKGYGILKGRFAAWLKMLNTSGKDVVLIAHMTEERSGDEIVERLDVVGGSKGEIYKSVDAMGRIFIKDKKRVLDFSPRENSFGKNPCNLVVLEIPDVAENNHFLADILAMIKSRLNQQTAEQKQMQTATQEMCAAIDRMPAKIEVLNSAIKELAKAPIAVKRHLIRYGESCGFVYDKSVKQFKAKPNAPPATPDGDLQEDAQDMDTLLER